MKSILSIFCIMTFVFMLSTSVFADTITLQNGNTFVGKVVEQSKETVSIQTAYALITLQREYIATVEVDGSVITDYEREVQPEPAPSDTPQAKNPATEKRDPPLSSRPSTSFGEWRKQGEYGGPKYNNLKPLSVSAVAFSANGKYVAASWVGVPIVRVWEVTSLREVASLSVSPAMDAQSVCFAPDNARIAVGDGNGVIRIWNIKDGKLLHTFKGHDSWVTALSFTSDGSRLLSIHNRDTKAAIWEVSTGRLVKSLEAGAELSAGFISPDGSRVIVGGFDALKVWDTSSWSEMGWTNGTSSNLAVSPKGDTFMTTFTTKAKVWDIKSMNKTIELENESVITTMAYTANGRHVIMGGIDQTVRIFDVQSGNVVSKITGHQSPNLIAAITSDGRRVITGGFEAKVMFWQQ